VTSSGYLRFDLEYFREVCQRQILAFVLEHRKEAFMVHKIEVNNPRSPQHISAGPGRPIYASLPVSHQDAESEKHRREEEDGGQQSSEVRFLSVRGIQVSD
jgi:hypothetical protein